LALEEEIIKKIEKISSDISELKKAYFIVNSDIIDKYMNRIFNTDIRRNIWIKYDCSKTQQEIGKLAGTSQKNVSRFIEKYFENGFLIDKNGKISKVLNYTPINWLQKSDEEEKE